jgi:hypothetical protein
MKAVKKMADLQLCPPNINFTMSNRAVDGMLGTASGLTTPANYVSLAAIRGALNAANATYYTVARMDTMTVNDLVFALRSIQDRTTIHDKMPVSTA